MKLIEKNDGFALSYRPHEKPRIYEMIQRRMDRRYTIDKEIRTAKRKLAELCDLRDRKLDAEINALVRRAKMWEDEEVAAHPTNPETDDKLLKDRGK